MFEMLLQLSSLDAYEPMALCTTPFFLLQIDRVFVLSKKDFFLHLCLGLTCKVTKKDLHDYNLKIRRLIVSYR